MEGRTAARVPETSGPAPAPSPASVPERGGAAAGRPLSYWLPSSLVLITVVCVALAALSAAVLPTVPSYDPWSWIVWGREVSDPHLSFVISGGPSWKPLPFCFTTLWGLFGGAAPTLWVVTARAGGLLGLVAAYRLGSQLAARARTGESAVPLQPAWRWAGPLAGLVAVAGVILTQDTGPAASAENWAYYMYRGTSEPMLIGSVLWAIDRHLAGRRGSAFVLLVAASLIRPETWPFLLAYGVWLWLREPSWRVLVVAGWISIPFLWFVPPWVGSGDPFLAASHAKSYNGHLGADRFLTVLGRGVNVQLLPVLLLGLVAVALAWRRRDRLVVGLGACAAVWWVVVVGMTLDGYPGLQRFYLPAAAVICVLAGVGIIELARLTAAAAAGGPAARRLPALGAAVAVALVVACGLLAGARISDAWGQRAAAAHAVTRLNQLSQAVAAVGGHGGVYPCRNSFAAVNHGVQTALAWKLHVTLERVGTVMHHSGIEFVGPHDAIDGGAAPLASGLPPGQLVATVGAWKVYRVIGPRADLACVGR